MLTILLIARVWGVFLACQKSLFCKNTFACLSEMVQIVGILCINIHVRIHTRTPRNTTLHHPSTHCDKDTAQNTSNHCKSVHIWIKSRNCLFRVSAMSRGSSWSSLDLETLTSGTLASETSAGAITKDCRWPGGSVRHRASGVEDKHGANEGIIGLVIVPSLSTCQQMCHLKPLLTFATNCTSHFIIPSMHNTSRSGHTPRFNAMFLLCLNVKRRNN